MQRLFFLLLWSGCSLASAAPFTLAPGQPAQAGPARITLLSVQDGRCPPRALCLMAGELTAKVMVTRGNTTRTLTLRLPGQAQGTPAGTLKLTAATRLGERRAQKLTFDLVRP